jgi:hypothetical protein
MSFVSADIQTDPVQLLDDGIDGVNVNLTAAGYPGWAASDATLAVIILGVVAQMIADAANVAAVVIPAIFRTFGTLLLGVPYQQGASASVLSTWTFTNPAPVGGYTIGAGTAVVVDGYVFYVQSDVITATSATSAVVTLAASQAGVLYNNLGGVNVGAPRVVPNQQTDWVSSIVTQGITSGGQDQETDDEYQTRLVGALQLQAPRPVVGTDFAGMVLSDIAENATGVAVGRATSLDNYFPDGRALSSGGAGSTVLSCTTVSASPTVTYVGTGNQVPQIGASVTGMGVPVGATVAASPAPTETTFTLSANATASATNNLTIGAMSGYGPTHLTCIGSTTSASITIAIGTAPYPGAVPDVGARVRGTGIPAGATVAASPIPTTTSFALSAAATSTNAGETITVSSWTGVQLANTTFVTDSAGNALSAANMDALLAWLGGFRPQNWLVNLTAPSYATVYVSALVKVLPGYSAASVGSSVQGALLAWLSQATWGQLPQQPQSWLNASQGAGLVRYKKAIEIAGSVPGVDYVDTLTLGFSASPSGTADLTMPGPAPLPVTDATKIIITTE